MSDHLPSDARRLESPGVEHEMIEKCHACLLRQYGDLYSIL